MQKDELQQLLENPSAMNENTAEELKQITETYPWFSLAWIIYLKNLKQINSPEYNSVLKNVAIRVPNRKLLHHYMHADVLSQTVIDETDNPVSKVDDTGEENSIISDSLIDKFLATNPGMIRRNINDDISEDSGVTKEILEKSSTESDELITETLANIYYQQKNFEKSLQAYQKLSLKYPEKSVYFAARIKEIEDLLNTN